MQNIEKLAEKRRSGKAMKKLADFYKDRIHNTQKAKECYVKAESYGNKEAKKF